MIQGNDCFGVVSMVNAPLTFLRASELSEKTKHKAENRRVVFLTEQELAALSENEYARYMNYLHWWLNVECHVGPFWLAERCHEFAMLRNLPDHSTQRQ